MPLTPNLPPELGGRGGVTPAPRLRRTTPDGGLAPGIGWPGTATYAPLNPPNFGGKFNPHISPRIGGLGRETAFIARIDGMNGLNLCGQSVHSSNPCYGPSPRLLSQYRWPQLLYLPPAMGKGRFEWYHKRVTAISGDLASQQAPQSLGDGVFIPFLQVVHPNDDGVVAFAADFDTGIAGVKRVD